MARDRRNHSSTPHPLCVHGLGCSIETAPFKLTVEMVDVMGGTESALFDEFITLFACGFFALQVGSRIPP